jgi:hypothetical protein
VIFQLLNLFDVYGIIFAKKSSCIQPHGGSDKSQPLVKLCPNNKKWTQVPLNDLIRPLWRFCMVTLKKSKGFFSFLALLSVFFVAVGGVVFQTPSVAQESNESHLAEISEINRVIQETGGRWVAGETPFSRLPLEEKQKWLGLIKPEITEMMQLTESDLIFSDQIPFALSPSLDWRNNGGNFVTPIRNQGGCGSCWAFATTGGLESYNLIRNNTPGIDLNLSEQVMVSCGISGGHDAGGCGGGYIQYASDYIRNTGLPLETCYPYTVPPNDGNCANACPNWESSAYKITKWSYAGYPYGSVATVEGLKTALTTYGPLVTTFDVYEDFYSYHSGVYSYVTGGLVGGHAVLLAGYDDSGQYFIVKNSWGTGWGESGYFRIAYSEMNTVVGFGEWTIAYGDPIPSNPETVTAPTTLSGTTCGNTNTSYSYSTGGSTSSSGHSVQYRFDWGDGTDSGWLGVGTTSASKSWSSPGTYSVKTQARCLADTSVLSSSSNSLDVAILGTPSNPSPASGATGISTTPTLSWTSSNASSYDVYFGTSSPPPFLTTTTSANYSPSGLSNNTKYYWKIVAKNSCGGSATGSVWSFTTACVMPGTPSIPTPSNGATGVSTSPTLSWSSSNVSSYDVYFGTSSSTSYVTTTTSSSYSTSGLNNNTTYYWKIDAKNSCGDLTPGPVWSFTTVVGTSTLVTVIQPNGGETIPVGSTQTIRWSAPAQATKFNLAYSTNNGATWRSIASNVTGSSYSWQVPTLTNSQKRCRVRVVGFDSKGVKVGEDRSDSTFAILGVKVKAPAVGATLTSGSTDSITWDKIGAIGLVGDAKIYYSKNGGATWILIATVSGETSSYSWLVPSTNGAIKNSCKVKVVLRDSSRKILATDISDGSFTLQPAGSPPRLPVAM